VTYRKNLVFNLEVARMRAEENEAQRREERFLRILLYKLGQMRPGMPNLLVIHARGALELDKFMQELKIRVERKDPSFYEISRYENPAAFYKDFLRLSAVLLWAEGTQLWVNKQARPALEEKVLRLVSSLAAGATTDGRAASPL
jgi:hypothetical protein